MDVPTLIVLLCNCLDRNEFSLANDLLHFGTHTMLCITTACYHLIPTGIERGPSKLHPSLHLSSEPRGREEDVVDKM